MYLHRQIRLLYAKIFFSFESMCRLKGATFLNDITPRHLKIGLGELSCLNMLLISLSFDCFPPSLPSSSQNTKTEMYVESMNYLFTSDRHEV